MTSFRISIALAIFLWAQAVPAQKTCRVLMPKQPVRSLSNDRSIPSRTAVQVQVVVHVVWKTLAENISDAQIHSQIEALNRDFNRANADLLPAEFVPLAAQANISFCLAKLDPFGAPTTGITRTKTDLDAIGIAISSGQRQNIHYTSLGGQDAWPTDRYINIWVGNLAGLYGRATLPGAAEHAAEDGLVIDPQYFGMVGTVRYPHHLGRTATHEMGHYLGLHHPWGTDQGECVEDDGIMDTPPQAIAHLGCPPHPQPGCAGPAMFMNFMDLVDDPCLLSFTAGQVAAMQKVLAGERSTLNIGACAEPVLTIENQPFKIQYSRDSKHVTLTFANGVLGPVQVGLFDPHGRQVFFENSWHERTFVIPASGLVSGIYFIVLRQAGNVVTKKVFIQS